MSSTTDTPITSSDVAVQSIDKVINDCYTHEDWDTADYHNFESMATLLERVRDYLVLIDNE